MAYIAEIIGRPGRHVIMSRFGEEIGVVEGANEEWRWRIDGGASGEEMLLPRAKASALSAANALEKCAPPAIDQQIFDGPHATSYRWRTPQPLQFFVRAVMERFGVAR